MIAVGTIGHPVSNAQTRRTGVAFIETPVRTAGAFDVDAEQVAVLNDFTGMVQRAQRLGATERSTGNTPTDVTTIS